MSHRRPVSSYTWGAIVQGLKSHSADCVLSVVISAQLRFEEPHGKRSTAQNLPPKLTKDHISMHGIGLKSLGVAGQYKVCSHIL